MRRIRSNSASLRAFLATVAIVAIDAVVVILIVLFIRDDLVLGVSRSDLEEMTENAVSNIYIRNNQIEYGPDFSFVEKNVFFLVLAEDGMVLSGRYPVNTGVEIGPPVEGFRSVILPVGEYYVADKRMPGARGPESIWIRGVESASNAGNINGILLRILVIAMPVFAALAGIASFIIARRAYMSNIRREKRFTSDVSHELRTPISVTLSQSEYLLGYTDDISEWKEGMDIIKSEAFKMKDMTESLLTLSRMEQGETTLETERLDVCDLLKSVSDETKNTKPDMEITISASDGIFIRANRVLLTQVFMNLLDNTYKYGNKSANIKVLSGYKKVTILYSDKGDFSDKKAVRHIFDPFYRTDSARSSGSGSGLGLALTERIIEGHRGSISARIGPEGGIIFKILLKQA